MKNRAVLVALIFCAGLAAQVNKSNLTGLVRDPSGAAIPAVEVTLTNLETGAVRQVTTDQTGLYRFTLLDRGAYRLEAGTPGFKSFSREPIPIQTGETVSVDISMEVGDITESVTVTSEAPLLRTESGNLGTQVNEQVLQELPLIGRNPYVFLTLSPGVQYYGSPGALNPWDNFGVSDFSSNGAEGRSEFLLDGIPNMRIDLVSFSPSPDAVDEMNLQTNTYDAEYGHSNASFVNVSTKGGSNEYHGNVYWYHRNDNLDANSFFNNRNGNPKNERKQNTYGGSVGGPIVRNKTHFHFNYEGTQIASSGFARAVVPTELERMGDFSQSTDVNGNPFTIYDPATTRPNPNGEGFIRDPFPGNVIPRERQDVIALRALEFYPLPNIPRIPGNQQNFGLSRPSGRDWNSFAVRGDHQLSQNHSLFLRYGWNHRTDPSDPFYGECCRAAGNPTTGQDVFERGNIAAGAGYTWVYSPSTVIDVRLGFTRYFDANIMFGEGFDIAELGFSQSLASQLAFATFPRFEMSGDVENLGAGRETSRNFINQYNPLVNVHSQFGRHALKYGFRYQVAQSNVFDPGRSGGFYRFDRAFTQGPDPTRTSRSAGHDIASFLLGTPSQGRVEINASRALQNRYYAFYVQDDWKTTNRLTLNLGIRFEHEDGATDRFDRGNAGFDAAVDSPLEAGAQENYAANPIPELAALEVNGGLRFLNDEGIQRAHLDTKPFLVAPRFGAAYRIHDNLVWRGGYGIYYNPNNVSNFRQDGFSLATQMITSLDRNLTPFDTLDNPFPNGLTPPPGADGGLLTAVGQSVTSAIVGSAGVPDYEHGYTHQFSTGFQTVLPANHSFEASYVGSRTHRTTIERDLNEFPNEFLALRNRLNETVPNPFYGVITDETSALSQPTTTVAQLLRPYPQFRNADGVVDSVLPLGKGWYNALQVQLNRRMGSGLYYGLAYTWSETFEATSYLNPNDARPEKVVSNADRPQRLVLHGIYELPFGPGKPLLGSSNGFLRRIVEGWQLNWVVTYQSGPPLEFDDAGTERIAHSDNNPRTIEEWFDTDQFVPQEPFTLRYMSSRIRDLRAAGIKRWDVTLMKKISITERVKMQLQGEFYNIFNTTHFDPPETRVTSTNFGRVSGTFLGPREVQVAARIFF